VKLSARYSNHSDQEKRIREVLQIELRRSTKPRTQTSRQIQRQLSTEELRVLLDGYEGGIPINGLAQQFGTHRSTVLDHLNRSFARRRYPALDHQSIEVAQQLYRAGLSLSDVGRLLEVHASTVRSAPMNAGIQMRDRHGYKKR
jgi:hypothetical protein